MRNVEIERRLAYRRAAASVQQLTKPLVSIFREKGDEGLRAELESANAWRQP